MKTKGRTARGLSCAKEVTLTTQQLPLAGVRPEALSAGLRDAVLAYNMCSAQKCNSHSKRVVVRFMCEDHGAGGGRPCSMQYSSGCHGVHGHDLCKNLKQGIRSTACMLGMTCTKKDYLGRGAFYGELGSNTSVVDDDVDAPIARGSDAAHETRQFLCVFDVLTVSTCCQRHFYMRAQKTLKQQQQERNSRRTFKLPRISQLPTARYTTHRTSLRIPTSICAS